MAALGRNAAVTRLLLLRQKSWKRERRSKCGVCCVAVNGAVTSQTLLLPAAQRVLPEQTRERQRWRHAPRREVIGRGRER